MSIRNLDSLFAPSSVAVFGASPRPASVGATVWSNLRSGGFAGPILAVNPKYSSLGGEPVHAGASHLPCVPELAVICTPPDTVAGLIDELGRRIFHSRRSIERSELARLTQIDYEREFAFIAEAAGPDGHPETLGAVRAVTDPDNVEAEFGIIVRPDLKGSGLGALLMDKLLRALREHGTRRVVATVLAENERMRGLARRCGFVEGRANSNAQADESVRAIALDLAPATGTSPP